MLLATLDLTGGASAAAGASAGSASPAASAASATSAGSALVTVSAKPDVPAHAVALGGLSATRVISGTVALAPRSTGALTSYVADVSNPRSPRYHHYLQVGAFGQEFGATPATVTAVTGALRAGGLHVGRVSSNQLLVPFSGRADQVAAAFGTSFASYRLSSGRLAYATTSAARLPATAAAGVQAVLGLNTLSTPRSMLVRHTASDPKGTVRRDPALATTKPGPSACPAARMTAEELGGLTDDAIAGAYGAEGLYSAGDTGAGQHIAVFELEPFAPADVTEFDSCYFGPAKAARMAARVSVTQVAGGEGSGSGSGESALDVEDVSALAPGADIDVYEAPPTTTGYLDNLNAIVTGGDPIVTTSWSSSECEAQTQAEQPGLLAIENTLFEQAAAQGQTVLAASGDDGSDSCAGHGDLPVDPQLSVADPAGQPYVTAVGGTTIQRVAKRPSERVWNDGSELGAGGGGVSSVWSQPYWQSSATATKADQAAVVAAEKVQGGPFCERTVTGGAVTDCRQVPDVSAQADEITGGITINFGGEWGIIGGTSSSAPLWAAMLADVDASPTCVSDHTDIGFVTPALYAIAGVPSEDKASFNDITVGDNDIFGASGGLFAATKGYDAATGLGSPHLASKAGGHGLAYYLCAPPAVAPPTISSVTPGFVSSAAGSGTGTAGQAQVVDVKGGGFEPGGTPAVVGVTVGDFSVPSSDVQVLSDTDIDVTLPPGAVQAGNGNPGTGDGTYNVVVTLTGGVTSQPSSGARLVVVNDPTSSFSAVPRVLAVTPSAAVETGGSTVTVYGTGFEGVGMGVSRVMIGGVAATDVTVRSDSELTAVVPAYSSQDTDCETGTDPTTDVCQTQVQVVSARQGDASALAPSLPTEFSGNLEDAPADEAGLVAQPTEFDYVPAPHLSSITFPAGTPALASEFGFSEVVLHGTGLGALGLDWVNIGSLAHAAARDAEFVALGKGTSIDLYLRATALASIDLVKPVEVETAGSPNQADLTAASPTPSNVLHVRYAALPAVTDVTTSNPIPAGPETGGTRVHVTGEGFTDATAVFFEDEDFGLSMGSDSSLTISKSGTSLSFVTPQENPGIDYVEVCDVTACSLPPDTFAVFVGPTGVKVKNSGHFPDTFVFYPPGDPRVSAVKPHKAFANDIIRIRGTNLGLATAVYFGSKKTPLVENEESGFLDSGDGRHLLAIVPRGLKVGRTVNVRVVTAESEVEHPGHPKSPVTKAARITIKKAPHRRLPRAPGA